MSIIPRTNLEPVSADEEAALVHAAQGGDQDAQMRLIALFAPALRSAIKRRNHDVLSDEDAESEAVAAFLTLVVSHDPASGPLAGRVAPTLAKAMSSASAANNSFSIPLRTVQRFMSIVRKADGDLAEAERIAPDFHMERETFRAVAACFRFDSLDGEDGTIARESATYAIGNDSVADEFAVVEDELLVAAAFDAVDECETSVVRFAYGFDEVVVDGDVIEPNVSDALVAAAMGLSRPKVQRTRTSALAKMRAALGVEVAA